MRTVQNKRWLVGGLVAVMGTGILSPSFALLDKTRFAMHLGEAFFAFHHWVYNPYKAGAFASGAPHRTKAMLKGGAALLFAVHEVKVSNEIAHKSKSPLLQKLAGSLDNLQSEWGTLGDKLKGGQFNPADIETANTHASAASAGSAAAGIPIKEKEPKAIPGTEDNR